MKNNGKQAILAPPVLVQWNRNYLLVIENLKDFTLPSVLVWKKHLVQHLYRVLNEMSCGIHDVGLHS